MVVLTLQYDMRGGPLPVNLLSRSNRLKESVPYIDHFMKQSKSERKIASGLVKELAELGARGGDRWLLTLFRSSHYRPWKHSLELMYNPLANWPNLPFIPRGELCLEPAFQPRTEETS